ncbi:MAG TPA: hypothetical protein VFM90_11095 [Cyclobacteriaceae bacterium]|nr:hypothetical protein [Cyclobacteriaceae bacterium]
MKLHLLCMVLFLWLVFGCEDDHLKLDGTARTFAGSFEVVSYDKFQKNIQDAGEITLHTADGIYVGAVHQAYGAFAGKLEVSSEKINFTDTLFSIYPANIIPPRVPRGKYTYTFDGQNLTFKRKSESGMIELYTLKLQK